MSELDNGSKSDSPIQDGSPGCLPDCRDAVTPAKRRPGRPKGSKTRKGANLNPVRGDIQTIQAEIDEVIADAKRKAMDGEEVNYNPKQLIDAIMLRAKLKGISESDLGDSRTDEDKKQDFIDAITESPDAIWTAADEQVKLVLEAMEECDRLVEQAITDERRRGIVAEEPDPQPRAEVAELEAKKAKLNLARSVLERVLKARKAARLPVWRAYDKTSQPEQDVIQSAAHLLRFMVYAGRSNITEVVRERHGIFLLGVHHAKMALGLWLARNRKELVKTGLAEYPPYRGAILIAPVGHGKSEAGVHFCVMEIVKDPTVQILHGHAKEDKAKENLQYVAAYFNMDDARGRRLNALFPGLRLAKSGNNAGSIRLATKERNKSPTMVAHGIKARVSGSNATIVWFDDPCDQEIAGSASMRQEVFDRINGTWMQRRRGNETFDLTTATLWHQDDPVSRRIAQANSAYRANSYVPVKVVIQSCGGPKSSRPFRPLWPAMYGEAHLRAEYRRINNPTLYSAIYQSNPVSEEARIIKAVRYYDPTSEEHARFLAGAVRRLSFDPTATRGELSDKAAMVYLAVGSIPTVTVDTAGKKIIKIEPRVRVLSAMEFSATQTELTGVGSDFTKKHPVDYVHVETRSAFAAVAEDFENRYGISVIRTDPTMSKKHERLRAVAHFIEDGNEGLGARAVVEFPGEMLEGQWVAREEIAWMVAQIINFGFTAGDHAVDALVQVLLYCGSNGELGAPIENGDVINRRVLHDDSTASRLRRCFEADRLEAEMEKPDGGGRTVDEEDALMWSNE